MNTFVNRSFLARALALPLAVALLLGFLFLATSSEAHEDPGACTNNDFVVNIGKSHSLAYDETSIFGATVITYTVDTGNPNTSGTGCNVDNIDINLTTPDGVVHNLQTGGSYPIGTAVSQLGTVNYTADSSDKTGNNLVASVNAQGDLHDISIGEDPLNITKQVSTLVINPSTLTTISASAIQVLAGGTVTLTITEQNDGDVDLTNPSVFVDNGVGTVTSTSVSFIGVDGGDIGVLDPGETWSWTVPGVVVNADTTFTATGHGTDPLLNDVTFPADQDEQDSVSVEVVQGLIVEKTSRTAYVREWDWTIEKSAATSTLELAEGESYTVNYTVNVSAVAVETLDASGTITITNPVGNPTATITSIADVLSVDGAATVDCPSDVFPQDLAPGASIVCTYQIVPGAPTDQTNTATVTTTGDVPGGSDTVPVDFGEPTDIDECIEVDDTYGEGPQGAVVCAGDGDNDETFNYAVTFGPQDGEGVDVVVVCGENNHPNIASFITQDDENDTGATGSDNWNVLITVNCIEGCTLTQGYWKTHNESFKGGAPADDNWLAIGGLAELTGFFTATSSYPVVGLNPFDPLHSWFGVFWTAPKGNAYYNLAHQYMAAKLNILNGASSVPSVDAAIIASEDFFDTYTPAAFLALGKKDPLRKSVIEWAGILGSFNEGLIGPGHCDEQIPE